ncbi:MAG: hypothetical protein PVI78_09050 [Anaerolineales bacterium]|jgi:hypothetical protein
MRQRRVIVGVAISLGALMLFSGIALANGDPPPEDNPVIEFLAELTQKEPAYFIEPHGQGHSLGNIARSYLFDPTGSDPQDVLSQGQGRGWGVLFLQAGFHPGGGGRGLGWMLGRAHGRPDHAGGGKPEGVGNAPEWAGGPGGNPGDPDD